MRKQNYRLILAFGSNLGDHELNFSVALNYLNQNDASFELLQKSRIIKSAPFENLKNLENIYSNFICECITDLHPLTFYQNIIVPIEDTLGHSRIEKWAPRALDIDILLGALNNNFNFSNCSPLILEGETFFLPHKRLLDSERKILQDLLKETFHLTNEQIQCHFIQILCEKN